ncbi:MAG TPA: glycine cleavage system aminomethyltransferase GcvT [Sporichthyaceae bacterium]|nr:glycine cleavage system aminomethyltransferase GcvT [Sporichthyaceae bacterium]
MTAAVPLRRSPLYDHHRALGAKMADFGGWEMPIDYGGEPSRLGVVAEHTAVRTAVGVFDVSHLGKVSVRGPGAAQFVDACLTNSLDRIKPGQAQYTLCCDAESGGIVDDLIVYLREESDLLLVPNAANAAQVARRLAEAAPPGVAVSDEHEAFAVLAVQGPESDRLLTELDLPVGHDYMSFAIGTWAGRPVTVCRSGYTGERGYELLPVWSDAGSMWEALLAAGGVPCGLGARDTLRTEMGYPLHGQDISLQVTPVTAGLGWAVGWDKPAFWGRDVLPAERAAGRRMRPVGLEALDRSIPRPHMTVRQETDGPVVGEVTSGTFSPTRKLGIGLALVAAGIADGSSVVLDVRGRPGEFRVVRPPFVPSRVR